MIIKKLFSNDFTFGPCGPVSPGLPVSKGVVVVEARIVGSYSGMSRPRKHGGWVRLASYRDKSKEDMFSIRNDIRGICWPFFFMLCV